MNPRRKIFILSGMFGLLLPIAGVTGDFPQYRFSGSFQSLATASETPINRDKYWSDLNRLRLDFDARFNRIVQFNTVIDNEFLIGSIIDTEEFQLVKDLGLDSNTRWDLDTLVVDNEDLVWRASVYRVFLKLAFEKANVIAGRQRIAWGTGRIWNPTDLFNPVSPLQIDQSQRDGVDSLSAEYFMGDLSSVNGVYALGQESDEDSVGARFGTNIKGYDLGLIVADIRQDGVVGADFGGNIGDAGFRGEATYTDRDQGDGYSRLVLSADYSWPNTVYLLVEYFYNGGNLGDTNVPDEIIEARARRYNGEIITKNKNFLATALGYEFTPLIQFNGLTIYDIDGGGWFVSPSLRWNMFANLDLTAGVQLFAGDADSEYGDDDNVYYLKLNIFF